MPKKFGLKKLATRRQFVVAAGGAALATIPGACSFRRPYDSQSIDLRGRNLTCDPNDPECDPPDLGAQDDLTEVPEPPDLTRPPADLTGVDQKGLDLKPPPDLTPPSDLTRTPDLIQPADLASSCPGGDALPGGDACPVGQAIYYSSRNLWLARDARGFMAIDNHCGHSSCAMRFNSGAATYDCPCHGSRFSLDGQVFFAPVAPVFPLKHFNLCRESGMLVVGYNFVPIGTRTT